MVRIKKITKKRLALLIDDYFEDAGSVKSLPGLALHLGVDKETLEEWIYEQKGGALSLAKTRIEQELVDNALRGKYNATTSTFLLKTSFGYREKAETGEPNGPLQVEVSDELRRFAV